MSGIAAAIFIADGTEEMELCDNPSRMKYLSSLTFCFNSTITYDTLVRAGVTTVSVFVPETSTAPHSVCPPVAKGSRGINIMPDMYLDRSELGPVNVSRLELIGPHINLPLPGQV